GFSRSASVGQLVADAVGLVTAGERAVYEQAAARVRSAGQEVSGGVKKMFGHTARGAFGDRLAELRALRLLISIQRLGEELFFVSKRRIKAWPVDAHGARQGRERRSFIAVFPENL